MVVVAGMVVFADVVEPVLAEVLALVVVVVGDGDRVVVVGAAEHE